MKILSMAQLALLTDAQRKEYEKNLEAYIAEFRTNHPDGVTCEVTVTGLSTSAVAPKTGRKTPRHSYKFITDDELVNLQIPQGNLLRPEASADIIARNVGFLNHTHMAVSLMAFSVKGTLKFTMNLRVKGEEYKTAKGSGTYKTTSFAQDDYEFVPSQAASARINEVTLDAAKSGFERLMFGGGAVQPIAPTKVADTADEEDIDI